MQGSYQQNLPLIPFAKAQIDYILHMPVLVLEVRIPDELEYLIGDDGAVTLQTSEKIHKQGNLDCGEIGSLADTCYGC